VRKNSSLISENKKASVCSYLGKVTILLLRLPLLLPPIPLPSPVFTSFILLESSIIF
jgi:hypothetical protein